MNKINIFRCLSLAMLTLLFSCSSDDDVIIPEKGGDSTKKSEIIVNVKGFDTEILDLKSASTSVYDMEYQVFAKIADRSYPVVMKEVYKYVAGDIDTMVIHEALPAGEYIIGMALRYRADLTEIPAEYSGETVHEHPVAPGQDDYAIEMGVVYPNNQWEMFAGIIEFTVTEDSPAIIEEELLLSRVMGKVEIVITDAQNMPASMTTLTSHTEGFMPRLYKMSAGKPMYFQEVTTSEGFWEHLSYFTDRVASRADIVANEEYTFSFYMLDNTDVWAYETPTAQQIKTDLYMKGDNGFEVKIKDGLKVYKNKITRLRGSLFDPALNSSISIETAWESTVIEESF